MCGIILKGCKIIKKCVCFFVRKRENFSVWMKFIASFFNISVISLSLRNFAFGYDGCFPPILDWSSWTKYEPPRDKTNKMACAHSEDSDQPGLHPPRLIRIFVVRMKKTQVLSYPLSAQGRLIRLGRCPGWTESSLGPVILLVLSWGGSYGMCYNSQPKANHNAWLIMIELIGDEKHLFESAVPLAFHLWCLTLCRLNCLCFFPFGVWGRRCGIWLYRFLIIAFHLLVIFSWCAKFWFNYS